MLYDLFSFIITDVTIKSYKHFTHGSFKPNTAAFSRCFQSKPTTFIGSSESKLDNNPNHTIMKSPNFEKPLVRQPDNKPKHTTMNRPNLKKPSVRQYDNKPSHTIMNRPEFEKSSVRQPDNKPNHTTMNKPDFEKPSVRQPDNKRYHNTKNKPDFDKPSVRHPRSKPVNVPKFDPDPQEYMDYRFAMFIMRCEADLKIRKEKLQKEQKRWAWQSNRWTLISSWKSIDVSHFFNVVDFYRIVFW